MTTYQRAGKELDWVSRKQSHHRRHESLFGYSNGADVRTIRPKLLASILKGCKGEQTYKAQSIVVQFVSVPHGLLPLLFLIFPFLLHLRIAVVPNETLTYISLQKSSIWSFRTARPMSEGE